MIDPAKRYGFMRDVESDLVDKILIQLKERFGSIKFLEVGVFGGGTVSGVVRKCQSLGVELFASGVDFDQWRPRPDPLPGYDFYAGDSMEMWRQIEKKGLRYNFAFIDGCHCVNHAMADFLNYSPLIVPGGICLFHDTALPKDDVKQGEWPQDHGYAGKPDSQLGVRDGLKKLGLLQGFRTDWKLLGEIPSDSGLMGAMYFEKLQEL